MRRFTMVFRSLLLMNLRNRTTLFWNFAFPIGLILLYGVIYGGQQFGAVDAMTWLTAGVVVLNIMSAGFIGDAAYLTNLRDQGVLQRVHAAPLPPAVLVGAYVLVRLVLVLAQAALIVATGVFVFGAQLNPGGLALALVLASFGALVFVALGQAVAALSPSASAAIAIGQVLYFPLMFISNLFMPVSMLPTWLASLTRYNPAYMLVDLMRPAVTPVPALHPAWTNLLGLLFYGLLGMMVAARFFRWEPKR